jgi:hypothetical protein
MVGKVERRAHRPDGGLAMFEAKPTAGGSGWPQLGAQLPPRGDVTLRSDRIGFGDCLVCIRARAREPVAAVAFPDWGGFARDHSQCGGQPASRKLWWKQKYPWPRA